MSNEVDRPRDPMAEFQEKLSAQVRENIRDLLPEEAVAKLVEDAVRLEFFEPRLTRDRYGSLTEKKPSWFVETVATVAEPYVKKAVEDYVAAHHDVIDKAITEFLDKNNLMFIAMSSLNFNTVSRLERVMQQMIEKFGR